MPEIGPKPLPTGDLPGKMPQVPPTEAWSNVPLATVSVTDTVTGSSVVDPSADQHLYSNFTADSPTSFKGSQWTHVGTSFNDALKSAAALSFKGAGIGTDPTVGKVSESPAVGLLQASDGSYYATGLRYANDGGFAVPSVGTPLVSTATQHPLAVAVAKTQQGNALQAVVFADQYFDLRNAVVGQAVAGG